VNDGYIVANQQNNDKEEDQNYTAQMISCPLKFIQLFIT
jgi:hypothetical protein